MGINSKNAEAIIKKKEIYFIDFHKVIYSLPSISCQTLELLAVTVYEISSFLCQSSQRAITKKKMIFFLIFTKYELLKQTSTRLIHAETDHKHCFVFFTFSKHGILTITRLFVVWNNKFVPKYC